MGTSPNKNDPRLPINSRYCKCSACGEYFTSDSSFSTHRVKDDSSPTGRSCADPAKILDKQRKPRLRLTTTGYWASSRRRIDFDKKEPQDYDLPAEASYDEVRQQAIDDERE